MHFCSGSLGGTDRQGHQHPAAHPPGNKDLEENVARDVNLPKSPDKRHSPCHNLLPLFLGGLPDNFPSSLTGLKALIAPYMLGIFNWS